MELRDLAGYAKQKHGLDEEHKWKDFPGFSVICHPDTGKWIALLMEQWNPETGEMRQCCDLKCGREDLAGSHPDWTGPPFRMKGGAWIGIRFAEKTDRETVFSLFEKALRLGRPGGFTMVLDNPAPSGTQVYQDIPLPFARTDQEQGLSRTAADSRRSHDQEGAPKRIIRMMDLYDYNDRLPGHKARNFVRQARLMEDYQDNIAWSGSFERYFPVYHDLNVRQLRGYFTWRTSIRQGEYYPVPASMAYIYIYELLNEVGAHSPEDVLDRLKTFRDKYAADLMDDISVQLYIDRWMFEFAVIRNLPASTVLKLADPEMVKRDQALLVLENPGGFPDDEVFDALCTMDSKKLADGPVISKAGSQGKALFAQIWKQLAAKGPENGRDVFRECFGVRETRRWYPLANAVYSDEGQPADADYYLGGNREWHKRDGIWRETRFEPLYFDLKLYQGILRAADRMLRRYLKTSRYLKARPEEKWTEPYIGQVLEADRQAQIEASRPKIEIDFSSLSHIRRDASVTRDSLLTEEELEPEENRVQSSISNEPLLKLESKQAEYNETGRTPQRPEPAAAQVIAPAAKPVIPKDKTEADGSTAVSGDEDACELAGLDGLHLQILRQLLAGQPVETLIRDHHLMPAIVTDTINEALYDELGDNALECDGDRISLVQDYRKDIMDVLGGNANE